MKITNKLFAEGLGTFWLVLGGCGTALFGHVGFLGVALAFGLTVVAMAYGVGHISGAHLNPAVSFGVFVNGRMSLKDMLLYWVAQCVGAVIAGAVLLVIWNAAGLGQTGVFAANGYGAEFAAAAGEGYLSLSMGGAFLVEALLTFVFLMVILGVTDSKHANGKFGGLAIGLTLTLIHLISIPLTNTRRLERLRPAVALHRGSARGRRPRRPGLQVPRWLLQEREINLLHANEKEAVSFRGGLSFCLSVEIICDFSEISVFSRFVPD